MQYLPRRQVIGLTAKAAAAATLAPASAFAGKAPGHGVVSGEPAAEKAGIQVLARGGNAVDAIVCGALAAAVASPHHTGIGGYGGHMILALANGRKVTAIDFNSTAPAAARDDMFPLDGNGKVRGAINQYGWLAAGVPGILSGLELALERYGTLAFREALAPAVAIARAGFRLSEGLAANMRGCGAQFRADEGSRKLYLRDGEPLDAGDRLRNPDLAAMLATLAQRNSGDSFYRGDIAHQIADAFKRNGGLVTAEDLAAYRANEVEPLSFVWQGNDIRTPPPTAGGLTVLQALAILRAMEWERQPMGFARTHARIEALRFAWYDRLRWLGDPDKTDVPVPKLLSAEYAAEGAGQIRAVVKDGKILTLRTDSKRQPGTINLSAVDAAGNMAVCTLTHGGNFGARVTVDGLGLTLGHGMSRFDPHSGHPNSPGPGKRPLHNMCPAIVLRDGQPVLGIGARGGRQIPNAVFEVLTQVVVLGRNMDEAVAAPRLHTEGNAELSLEKSWAAGEAEAAAAVGYKVKTGTAAVISAVSFDPRSGECRSAMR
jgi:gamma-glutamyltranspeptidase / glutathione hydrolase